MVYQLSQSLDVTADALSHRRLILPPLFVRILALATVMVLAHLG